jgi:hypothetical protein
MNFAGLEMRAGCHLSQAVPPPSWDEQLAVARVALKQDDTGTILRALGLLP